MDNKSGANVNNNMQIINNKYVYDNISRNYVLVPVQESYISPLELAMRYNFMPIAQLLINNGADTSCLTKDDKKKLNTSFNLITNS